MGVGVKRAREKAGLSAAKLEQKTRDLGYPVTRGTIAKIEGGHRDGKFDVNEVVVLAAALDVAPLDIIYPPTTAPVEYLPGQSVQVGQALLKFSDSRAMQLEDTRNLMLRTFDKRYKEFLEKWAEWQQKERLTDAEVWELDALMISLGAMAERIQENWNHLGELGLVEGDDPRAPDYERAIETLNRRRAARDQRRENNG